MVGDALLSVFHIQNDDLSTIVDNCQGFVLNATFGPCPSLEQKGGMLIRMSL